MIKTAQRGISSVLVIAVVVVILAILAVSYFKLSRKNTPNSYSTPQSLASVNSTNSAATSTSNKVSFDNYSGQEVVLNGQYPQGMVDWGTGNWYVSGPNGAFPGKSVVFNGDKLTSAVMTFIKPAVLKNIDAYNADNAVTTITLSCPGQDDKQTVVQPNQVVTIETSWTDVCKSVTVSSSNGWNTAFNNLVLQ